MVSRSTGKLVQIQKKWQCENETASRSTGRWVQIQKKWQCGFDLHKFNRQGKDFDAITKKAQVYGKDFNQNEEETSIGQDCAGWMASGFILGFILWPGRWCRHADRYDFYATAKWRRWPIRPDFHSGLFCAAGKWGIYAGVPLAQCILCGGRSGLQIS